jgi:photosystem II stability/assembly factor-like uncharacterized protein
MSPDDPNRLYAFVVGNGIFQSSDGGRTWQMLSDNVPGDIMGMAAAGGAPETLYAGSMRFGILRSTDGGHSWNSAMPSAGSDSPFALAVDPQNHQTVYAGGENGLLKTTDGGATWRKLPFPAKAVVAITVSLSQPSALLESASRASRGWSIVARMGAELGTRQ